MQEIGAGQHRLDAPIGVEMTGVDLSRPLITQLPEVIAAFEERYLRRALRKARGDLGRVSKLAGLPRPALLEKLAQYKIDRSRFKEPKDA